MFNHLKSISSWSWNPFNSLNVSLLLKCFSWSEFFFICSKIKARTVANITSPSKMHNSLDPSLAMYCSVLAWVYRLTYSFSWKQIWCAIKQTRGFTLPADAHARKILRHCDKAVKNTQSLRWRGREANFGFGRAFLFSCRNYLYI